MRLWPYNKGLLSIKRNKFSATISAPPGISAIEKPSNCRSIQILQARKIFITSKGELFVILFNFSLSATA